MEKILSKDEIIKILKEKKIKITPNRLKVAEIIINSKKHPSIDEIHTQLIKNNKNVSFTSVYNIIKMFQSANLIKVIKAKDRSRYDADMSAHSHFICSVCGRVFDYEDDVIINNPPEKINGMKVNYIEVIYHGICNECNL
jgi:Fur family peroxide stress response transcriptional regulator